MAKQKHTTDKAPAPAAPEGASTYTVLARRYRPQTFADLVGQGPVARALTNALTGNRVAHAYLFTGARGVGKTSTARILAKALNCINGPTPEPCGTCDLCLSIASGEDVDVLEIDGASNNGVDNIRDLRGNVQYLPQRARFKIYVIDEVHMLSKGAFNALLKTLEEPPPHVKFIFATTEVDKVPITILSRCQRFDFAGIPLPRIVERLRTIVDKEGVKADDAALEQVARRATGSMRDAQSLLDQLLAFGGDRLTVDQVHHLLGTAGDERILGLAEAVVARDAKKALDLLDEAVGGGLQLGELVDQLVAYWRDLMVVHCGGTEAADLSVPARHHDTLRRHAGALNLDSILAGLDVLSATKARLRGSNHGRTLVEMALVRLSRLQDLVALSQLTQWLGQMRNAPPGVASTSPAARPLAGEAVKKKPLIAPPEGAAPTPPEGPVPLAPETLPALWGQILASLGGMLASELQKVGLPAISGPNALVLRFPSAYNRVKEFCQSPERLARIEEATRKVIGRSCIFRIDAEAGPAPIAANVAGGERRASGAAEGESDKPRPRRNAKEEAEKVPLVKRAIEVLGATVQRVDDNFAAPVGPEKEGNGHAPEQEP